MLRSVKSGSGLSSGAKAGIAIAVVIGVVGIATALAFCLGRRSKKVGGWQRESLEQDFGAYPNERTNTIELQQGRGYFQ